MKRMKRKAVGALALLSSLLLAAASPPPAPPLAFPRDHGSHPDAAIEWWYYTGNLSDGAGNPFGFQLTFFRVGDFALAHGAWTDGARRTFEFEEKAHLTLPGIAEFAQGRLEVSNENWSASAQDRVHRLRLRVKDRAVDLVLTAAKPPLLQGDKGLSRKGPGENEYSHYVSIPRLSASGTLVEAGRRTAVAGTAWFDHEWGPGALPAGAAGWDWFAFQLDDGSDLMLYRIRTKEGGATRFSSGVFVPPAGDPVALAWEEVRFQPVAQWRSPRSKGVYPSGWEIEIPRLSLALRVDPLVADQELVTGRSTGVTYWEGACRLTGRRGGKPLTGKGYAELTGYSGRDVPGFTSR